MTIVSLNPSAWAASVSAGLSDIVILLAPWYSVIVCSLLLNGSHRVTTVFYNGPLCVASNYCIHPVLLRTVVYQFNRGSIKSALVRIFACTINKFSVTCFVFYCIVIAPTWTLPNFKDRIQIISYMLCCLYVYVKSKHEWCGFGLNRISMVFLFQIDSYGCIKYLKLIEFAIECIAFNTSSKRTYILFTFLNFCLDKMVHCFVLWNTVEILKKKMF